MSEPWEDPPSMDEIRDAYYGWVGFDIQAAGKDDGSEFELSSVTTVIDDLTMLMVERIVRTLWSRRRGST